MEERQMDSIAQMAPLLDMFVSRLRDGVILTDNLGTVLYTNLAACCLLGMPQPNDPHRSPTGAAAHLSNALLGATRTICAGYPKQPADHPIRHFIKQRIDHNGSSRVVDIEMTTLTLPDNPVPMRLMFISEAGAGNCPASGLPHTVGGDLFTDSPRMREIRETLVQIAPTMASVLLQGESGTGKTLLARMIHMNSRRADAPLVEINCAAIPDNLLESELFGHVKGAFTGAVSERPGRLQAANGGTLFLDEVSDIPLQLQPKLLKALEEKCFQMVGSDKNTRVDVRIIAASNRNLRALVDAGQFRADLYYRLAVFSLTVPALRERPDDIPALIEHLHRRFVRRGYQEGLEYSAAAMAMLLSYPWPGNVRELANAVEHAMILAKDGVITPKCLPADIQNHYPDSHMDVYPDPKPGWEIAEALEAANGNRAEAARMLGIDRTTLWRRMHRLGLT
jgi:DNA-binding NtrC family response regulator